MDQCPQSSHGAVVDAKGCQVASDSDGDGVMDKDDDCLTTVVGAVVNARGCEVDSDGDGIIDRMDSCPNTTANSVVGDDGCDVDSDGDGVIDSMDNCPDSNSGDKVDVNGCVIPEVFVLKGVIFATGRDEITNESTVTLDEVAVSLIKHPGMVVEVAGYTDDRGSRQLNEALSQQRAASVVSYLVDKGVLAENLKAKGYGPVNPVADNNTVEGRAQNRRVELHILVR